MTHSKRMMQAADMIYGVTMQEPGVSKVISVKLAGSRSSSGRRRERSRDQRLANRDQRRNEEGWPDWPTLFLLRER